MKKTENILIPGVNQKPIVMDIFQHDTAEIVPVVLFVHGFKGFKNWGHFDLIAEAFVEAGYCFAKLNFSHNGTQVNALNDFVDLDAFGHNNFSMELDELKITTDYLEQHAEVYGLDFKHFTIIGHSRGGGISILFAHEDERVKKLITWASISAFDNFFSAIDLEKWKSDGVVYSFNSRTKQNMPLYFQLYENFERNKMRLSIEHATKKIQIPWMIVHGRSDQSVTLDNAEQLHAWNTESVLKIIENADHTFGGKHPFTEAELPLPTQELVEKSIQFLNE